MAEDRDRVQRRRPDQRVREPVGDDTQLALRACDAERGDIEALAERRYS